MKIEIDEYRGWEIFFDTEKEMFYTVSDMYDTDKDKKTYSGIKTFIDEFIKDNLKFQPVWIERPETGWRSYEKIKLIGIRKDKRLVYEDNKGKRCQLSEYDEKDYILCNKANDEIFRKIKEHKDKVTVIENEIKKLEESIISVGIESIKSQYLI